MKWNHIEMDLPQFKKNERLHHGIDGFSTQQTVIFDT
jgi:hypothetical protein